MTNKCKYFCMGTPRPMARMNQTMLCRLIFSLSNYNFIHNGSLGISYEYVCEKGANWLITLLPCHSNYYHVRVPPSSRTVWELPSPVG